ncbi:uncharacterized protein LOC116846822 isoform X1 [Odontomachus brunneus]|uniref:uncharacterized protein LOC116846822 isoform X1 n=1 Tax=Odontomachus brunneus TaxID=486640 RepID=UPI0013F1F394|nr:uncharacterized protein LOC116846822 isoform X1 [Odontomachus brunneus]
MGWSKRGNGRSYDSLNGYGAVIGYFSGKILDFSTRNRKCKKCDIGQSSTEYDCRKNFKGSNGGRYHLFGHHENCRKWYTRASENGNESQTIFLKDPNLYIKLRELFSKYANNAAKFSVAASSQVNESVNNIMCHKAPKNHCYCLSESSDYCYSSTVCTMNDGENYLLNVEKELCVSPGKHTKKFASRQDKTRRERARKAKLPSTKYRRNMLLQKRILLREQKEKAKGIQYQSNCGLELDAENSSIDIDVSLVESTLEDLEKSPTDYKIVYFDLETSGFSKTTDILQRVDHESFHVNLILPIDHVIFSLG